MKMIRLNKPTSESKFSSRGMSQRSLNLKGSVLAIAMAALTTSCDDSITELDNGDDNNIQTSSIVITAPIAATNIGFQWATDAKIGVTNSMSTATFAINDEAKFEGSLLTTASPEIITAVYPATTTMTFVDSDGDDVKDALESSYSLSNTQSDLGGLEANKSRLFPYLYGATSAKTASTGTIDIPMQSGLAVVELKLSNIPDDTTLSSIEIACEDGVSASKVTTLYNLEDGSTTLTPSTQSFEEMILTVANAQSVSGNASLYLVVAAQEIAAGTTWNINVMHAVDGANTKLGNSVDVTFDSDLQLTAGNLTDVPVALDIVDTFEHEVTLSSALSLEDALASTDITMMNKLTIKGNMTEADIVYTRNLPAVKILDMSQATIDSMPEYLYSDDGGKFYPIADVLEQVMLPKGLTVLPKYTFERCASLISVTIPEGYEVISASSFESCAKLIKADFPSTVTQINEWAFESTAITAVEIPASVNRIGNGAFYKCMSLVTVKFLGNIPATLHSGSFTYSHDDRKIYVPESQVEAFQAALSKYASQITGY